MSSILIVDDRDINREFLVTLLGYSNHQISEAQNGIDALEKIKKTKPDLIITDILMPSMNGYELAQTIRNDSDLKSIPIIFYTATYRLNEAQLLAASCNVKYVLTKPSEPETILDTVNKALLTSKSEIELSKNDEYSKLMNDKKFNKNDRQLIEKISHYLKNSSSVKNILNNILQKNENMIGSFKQTSYIADLKRLIKFNTQLSELIALNLDLLAEKDQNKLIKLYCLGAKAILETKYCGFCLMNSQEDIIDYFIIGENKQCINLNPAHIRNSTIGQLLNTNQLMNITDLSILKLPADHAPIKSFFGIRLSTSSRTYGCIYFADKVDGMQFNEDEDKLILHILASELSISLENIDLYDLIQRHAATLQIEISDRKKFENDLRQSEKLFRQFAENIKDVFWRITPNLDKMIYISPAYEDIWQQSCEEVYKNPLAWFDFIVEEDQQKVRKAIYGEKNLNIYYKIKRQDGSIRKIYARGFLLKDKNGKIESNIGIATDITEFEKSKQWDAIQSAIPKIISGTHPFRQSILEILSTICTNLECDIGEIWMVDDKKSFLYCIENWSSNKIVFNDFIQERIGLTFKPGEGLPGLIFKKNQPQWSCDLFSVARKELAKNVQLNTVFGVPIVFMNNILGVLQFFSKEKLTKDDKLLNVLEVIGAQIGEYFTYTRTNDQLFYLSEHDALTEFYNRITWENKSNTMIENKTSTLMAVLILDIDRFKLIIETMSHDICDEILQKIATKIRETLLNKDDLVGRFGFEKFVITLTFPTNIEQINYFAMRLVSLFNTPFLIKNNEIFLTVSVGISIYPQDGTDTKTLLMKSEIALDRSKEQGGNCFNFFIAEQQSRLFINNLELENQMRHALTHNELILYYQPQVDLKTGKIVSFESLIRWNHPQKGILSPGEFLSHIEQTDLIGILGEWVLREACHQILRIDMPIAVNLSVNQFRPRYNLYGFVHQLIKETNIDPKLLELEITEGVMITNIVSTLDILTSLKSLGVHFSLDDFGTGYSSLNYLKNFPVNRACPHFSLSHIKAQAIKSIALKFLANFSNRVAILRKCFSFANKFSTKCLVLYKCLSNSGLGLWLFERRGIIGFIPFFLAHSRISSES